MRCGTSSRTGPSRRLAFHAARTGVTVALAPSGGASVFIAAAQKLFPKKPFKKSYTARETACVMVLVVVVVVVVVVVAVWDTVQCVCMYTPQQAATKLILSVQAWRRGPVLLQASANTSPLMARNQTLILLIKTPPLVVSKYFRRMTHMMQALPHTWPRLGSRNTREVCRFFLFRRILFLPGPEPPTQPTSSPPASTSTTSTTPLSAVTRPAACPDTGKRQIGTLLANRTAQYLRGRVPASNAGADRGGYRKRSKPIATPFPPNMPKPAMISPTSTRDKPT